MSHNLSEYKKTSHKNICDVHKQTELHCNVKFSITAQTKVPYQRQDSLAGCHSNPISNFQLIEAS